MESLKMDHRSRVTRAMIRKAFTGLLSEKPIQNVTVIELCQQAGINRGTFYKHYKDIYDLLERIEGEMFEEFVEAISPLVTESVEQIGSLEIAERIFRCLQENSDLCIVTLGNNGDKHFADRLIDYGRDRMMDVYPKIFSDTDKRKLEYYYSFVSAGCIGLLRKWLDDDMPFTVSELAQMAETIMISGIAVLSQES